MVRPRGWHLDERHLLVDGAEMSGSLFDFGLYVFHSAKTQMAQGATPAFYLPKLESHLEARLWNDVFVVAQQALGVPVGTFKATVLIETLPAAFEMDEILYELRDHIVGLNCGRWDYIFSFIKRLGKNPAFLTPDRAAMTMGKAFLAAYSLLLIKTCHRRGAFAMGGMAAQIPIKGDPAANEAAFAKVRADKEREAGNGHDGTWVAHPDLVPVAREVFDRLMPGPNQLAVVRDDVNVTRERLAESPRRRAHRSGLAREHPRRRAIYRSVAARPRRGAALQSDGGRRDGGNLARAGLAMAPSEGQARRRPRRHAGSVPGDARRRDGQGARRRRREAAFDGGRFAEAIELFAEMSLSPDLRGVPDPAGVSADRLKSALFSGMMGDGVDRDDGGGALDSGASTQAPESPMMGR